MTLDEAIVLAVRRHTNQTDKQGQPYIRHCLRVMEAVAPNRDAMIVAVLHDVLEDTGDLPWPLLVPLQSEALRLLTRQVELQTYASYIDTIAAAARRRRCPDAGGLALKVKLADLEDNLGRMGNHTAFSSLRRRYTAARGVLLDALVDVEAAQ